MRHDNDNIASSPSHWPVLQGEVMMMEIKVRIDGNGWKKIGTMWNARRFHATSLIKFEEFERYCK